MKKSILFSILFFMATAFILLYSTSCEKDDAPVTTKIIYIGAPQAIDAEGNATLVFNGYCSNPDVSRIVYSVKAVAGTSDKTTTIVATDDDDDDDDEVTTKAAGSSLRVISQGTGCTVLFHTDSPETFPGATIVVSATQVVYNDGRVGLILAQSASTTATASVLPMEVNPDDPDDPDDPEDPEDELAKLLENAEALDDNTISVNDEIFAMNPMLYGGYICFHNFTSGSGEDLEIVGYTIHCMNNTSICGVSIDFNADRLGEAFEMPIRSDLLTKATDVEEALTFFALKDPSAPQNTSSNPLVYYSTYSDYAANCVMAERAVVKVVENGDGSMTALAYLLAEDGNEFYAKYTAFNPSYEK